MTGTPRCSTSCDSIRFDSGDKERQYRTAVELAKIQGIRHIGTKFDLRAELFKNGVLVASGAARCLTGITSNPTLAKEVTVLFDPFPSVEFNGPTDTLSLKLLTRIGTNPDDTKCIGPGNSHNNAAGLRMYFDGVSNSSLFGPVTP